MLYTGPSNPGHKWMDIMKLLTLVDIIQEVLNAPNLKYLLKSHFCSWGDHWVYEGCVSSPHKPSTYTTRWCKTLIAR